VTRQYLIGELSVRLEQLQAVATSGTAKDVVCLRHEVEGGPPNALAPAAARAIALADSLCWESLAAGDTSTFCRQAAVSADLHLFGVCARLLDDG
jgi:hypothetical protein